MLSKQDKKEIQEIIDRSIGINSEKLSNSIVSKLMGFMLENFYTKDEIDERFATKVELHELRVDVNELKDSFALQADKLDKFMAFTDNKFQDHDRRLSVIETRLAV